jgi:hypothetical protein
LTFTIPLFHERPTQSNLKQRDGLKKKRKVFYGEQPIEATTIIALDLFNDVTKTVEQLKLALFGFRQQSSETNYV